MPPPAESASGWVVLARVVKTQGRRGELAADLTTDIAGRFAGLAAVHLRLGDAPPRAFTLLRHWPHKGRVVLALAGLEDISAASAWIGADVCVPAADRAPAPAGGYFISDLEGCRVFADGRELGCLRQVLPPPATAAAYLLRIESAAGEERLIPFAAEYLQTVDLAARRLDLRLPAGLLEVNEASR